VGEVARAELPLPAWYLWCDLETTGLNLRDDRIVEVAAILTGPDFVEKWRYHAVVAPDAYTWARIGAEPVVKKMHEESGLLDHLRTGTTVPLITIETDLTNLLAQHPGQIALAGSGVAHFDSPMLRLHMPMLAGALHWRPFDVGQLEEWLLLAGIPTFEQAGVGDHRRKTHRALDDIEYHLSEGQWYRARLEDRWQPLDG
jgi:oligoribonuclease